MPKSQNYNNAVTNNNPSKERQLKQNEATQIAASMGHSYKSFLAPATFLFKCRLHIDACQVMQEGRHGSAEA